MDAKSTLSGDLGSGLQLEVGTQTSTTTDGVEAPHGLLTCPNEVRYADPPAGHVSCPDSRTTRDRRVRDGGFSVAGGLVACINRTETEKPANGRTPDYQGGWCVPVHQAGPDGADSVTGAKEKS